MQLKQSIENVIREHSGQHAVSKPLTIALMSTGHLLSGRSVLQPLNPKPLFVNGPHGLNLGSKDGGDSS